MDPEVQRNGPFVQRNGPVIKHLKSFVLYMNE